MKKKDIGKESIALHKKHKGKLGLSSHISVKNKKALSFAYTPGVASVSREIAKDKTKARILTIKANTVAIVSDGSAVLGLGNIGPEAALPVMEGKAVLLKEFAGVDAFPIVLDTQDTEEIIETVKRIAPGFGGINLEDISAPRCFEIEERLKKELDIPVFHDDQHGTAIVVLAGLINALRVVKKDITKVQIVINGAGAAASAIAKLLLLYGVPTKNLKILDSKGTLSSKRKELVGHKKDFAKKLKTMCVDCDLKEAVQDSDVFIGVSAPNVLTKDMVESMSDEPIVFAMANPDPEIAHDIACKTKIAVFGTGRSDYPNQVNNVLAFPGIFRGVLDIGATQITEDMKIATAETLARLVSRKELSSKYILPEPFDSRIVPTVARAIKRAYRK